MYEIADKLYKDTMVAEPWPKKNQGDIEGTGFHLAFNVYPAADAQSYANILSSTLLNTLIPIYLELKLCIMSGWQKN